MKTKDATSSLDQTSASADAPPLFELVLPCYNEAQSLKAMISRCRDAANASGFTPRSFQLIIVENGSKDHSRDVLKQLSQSEEWASWFRVVHIESNRGYGYGLSEGLNATRALHIGWSHADEQCDPRDAFRALDLLLTLEKIHPEVSWLVKGHRRGRSFKEQIFSRCFELLALLLLGVWLREINAQPKVFRRSLLSESPERPVDFAFDLYMLYQARRKRYRFKSISVNFPPRVHGLSNWASSLRSRSKTILNMIGYMAKLRNQ